MKQHAICFTFDKNYVIPAAVTFKSLLENKLPKAHYHLYVLHGDVTEAQQKQLQDIVAEYQGSTLSFINTAHILADIDYGVNFSKGDGFVTFTIDTMYRCILDTLPEFNHIDKMLYSDVDIVINDDISELFDLDLKDHYLAGCLIPNFVEHQSSHLDPKFKKRYFGGGIWLLNLNKMRQDKIGQKALDIIKNPPCKLPWNDQDVMNLACDTNFLPLSYRYCSIPAWHADHAEAIRFDEYYPNRELFEAIIYPKITHYAYAKPWVLSTILGAELWYYWLKKTPFSVKDFPKEWLYGRLSKPERLLVKTRIGILFLLLLMSIPLINKLPFVRKLPKHRDIYLFLLQQKFN
ncbi:MAG: glycosyltransferase family 8 protein [Brevinema sp.]